MLKTKSLAAASVTLALAAPWGGLAAMTASASATPNLVPHRAIYDLRLSSASNGSPVADVDGLMSVAWTDACDGWTTEQRFEIRFSYAEGEDVQMSTTYATWESKDGRSYRFNVRKLLNGKTDEELRGSASLDGDKGGVAHFELPEVRDVALQAGTLFPSAHTFRLLDLAAAGEKFFARPIFDGSEKAGAATVSAVVGRPRPAAKIDKIDAALTRGRAWPISLSFFDPDTREELPQYQTVVSILDNGVIDGMGIDYGEFKVKATLRGIEAIQSPHC